MRLTAMFCFFRYLFKSGNTTTCDSVLCVSVTAQLLKSCCDKGSATANLYQDSSKDIHIAELLNSLFLFVKMKLDTACGL